MTKENEFTLDKFFNNWEKRNVDETEEGYVFKYGSMVYDAYIAGFKKSQSILNKLIHNLEEDQLANKDNKHMYKSFKYVIDRLKTNKF